MKIKTSELTGAALDWAVAKCELPEGWADDEIVLGDSTDYSTDREQGGPIIEREGIGTQPVYRDGELVGWVADSKKLNPEEGMEQYGPTPLIAGLRCYAASKLGDEVDVPEEISRN